MKVTILGRGRVGTGLAGALQRAGIEVRLVPGTEPKPRALAEADVVILATPDPSLADVGARASSLAPNAALLHCSGSLSPDVLAPHSPRGAMHPLVSFAAPDKPPTIEGATFVIAGDVRARQAASRIARAVGAHPLMADVHGPAYHAAAALSANGAAALAMIAVEVLQAEGLDRAKAQRAIGALLRTVGENVERIGVPNALSGPVVRGDVDTVARHREALDAIDPAAREAYDAVAPAILECARRAGLPEERARALEALLASPAEPQPSTSE